jgi:hypothetical protein
MGMDRYCRQRGNKHERILALEDPRQLQEVYNKPIESCIEQEKGSPPPTLYQVHASRVFTGIVIVLMTDL